MTVLSNKQSAPDHCISWFLGSISMEDHGSLRSAWYSAAFDPTRIPILRALHSPRVTVTGWSCLARRRWTRWRARSSRSLAS